MFSKPESGWVDINIGEQLICGSYLTDIPFDFLNSLINSLDNNLPFAVFIDEEGTETIICAYYCEVYIVTKHNGKVEYQKISIDFDSFRKEIVKGIEMYFNEWIHWNLDDDVEKLKSREKELKNKLKIAKEKLNV